MQFPNHVFPGKLFSIEGVGGSTKSTQAHEVADVLRSKGFRVVETSLPQYELGEFGPRIRTYLQNPEANTINPYQVAEWYIQNRKDFRPQVVEWIQDGMVVISARAPMSNVAYQGAKLTQESDLDTFCQQLLSADYLENGYPREDLLILLKAPVAVSLAKAEARYAKTGDSRDARDGHEQSDTHVQQVLAIYERYTQDLPFGRVINCAPDGTLLPKEVITRKILDEILPLLR